MDFVKNNWAKLVISILALVGVIVTSILLFQGPVKDLSLGEYTNGMYDSSLFALIAQLLFFTSIVAYTVLRMFESTRAYSGYVMLALAVGALVFAVLSMTSALAYVENAATDIQNGFDLAETLPSGVEIEAIGNITKEAFVNKLEVSKFALTSGTYAKIVNMLVFAIMPIAYSLKKIIKKSN